MAKSRRNVVTQGLSGTIGTLVFSQRGGQTIVRMRPQQGHHTFSEEQKEHQRRFQRAILYGKTAIADAETKAGYQQAAKPGQSAFNVAVADFFNAPVIERIDLSNYTGKAGDTIQVYVYDDFAVKEVRIRISNADGSLVEEGAARTDAIGYEWTYVATQTNESLEGDRIEVFVSDTPGNVTHEEREL
ncbi:MAG: hypothetical protein LBB90_12370 [Tannerella sp.]|jgi:hypothetical protein|nr:hypothetical protein [Tannerella sp.]